MNTVWRISPPGDDEKGCGKHPTQKPLELVERCLLAPSNEGAVVLDPFMGSGTTLCAAKDLGRRAIGIEIKERFCELAARRLGQGVFRFDSVTGEDPGAA